MAGLYLTDSVGQLKSDPMPRTIPPERFGALVEAATAVFLEQGYRRTQIADVARRMGVSKGSVYTYVESKEALFDCVLRSADARIPSRLPDELPVATPQPRATLAAVRKRLEEQGALPELHAALARGRVPDVAAELRAVLGELYDVLARHRTAIKLLDRCAPEYPKLGQLWNLETRGGALALLERYVADRARRGRLRKLGESAAVTRLVIETLAFWAIHRHWDPVPQSIGDGEARRTALSFLVAALAKENAPAAGRERRRSF
jgi:AcrR family transcriptional regulator